MSLLLVGRVLTMDPARPEAEAVAVRDGRVVAAGPLARVAAEAPGARRIDLGEGVLLPGFHDAHTHLVDHGVRLLRLQLRDAATREEALRKVAERARATPEGGWVVGSGWDETKWPDPRAPTRAELDAAAPKNPVVLFRIDLHMAAANSEGLKRAGVWEEDGLVREEKAYALDDAVEPAPSTVQTAIVSATRASWALGVTSVHAIVDRAQLAALREAREARRLGVRVGCYVREPDFLSPDVALARDPWLSVLGVKLFTDGSIGSHTAAVSSGFADAAAKGGLVYAQGMLDELVAAAAKKGLQPALHAIGDLGVEAALRAFRAAGLGREARPRIEHAELTTDAQIAEMASRGVVASMQPNFVGEWGHPGQMYARRLGDDVVGKHNRLRDLADARVPLAFGSDHMPYGPLYGLHSAVNGPTRAQRLTVDEALRAYTTGSAFAGFEEGEKGTIAPGKHADFVLLDADPRERPTKIEEIRVRATWVAGSEVYRPHRAID